MVARGRLLARLDDGKPLTLITAPAGYGKTTLLSGWTATLKTNRSSKVAPVFVAPVVCWLSLDGFVNDLQYFLAYTLQALKESLAPAQHQASQAAIAAYRSPQAGLPQELLNTLLNSIGQSPRTYVLILDDYHNVTDAAVHQAVQYILSNQPGNLRLVISSRTDPPLALAQLRVHDRLCEIRMADLAFTYDETLEFLNHRMELNLSEEDIASVEQRTEGWAAGLQMTATLLKGRTDRRQFIQAFSGSHRFVLEYLLEEVFNRQPAAIQSFLLRTSILERLCAPLCDAVAGKNAGDGEERGARQPFLQASSQDMLEYLERANIFLVALDEERQWYRYHHLFAELLRHRLMQTSGAETVKGLYRRAIQWYESHGYTPEAIALALTSPETELAADLLEMHVLKYFYQSEITLVNHWLAALPDTQLRRRPLLCAVYAATIALLPPFPVQSLPAAEKWMLIAEQLLDQNPQGQTLARAFALNIRSYWARFQGAPFEEIARLVHQALAIHPAGSAGADEMSYLRIRSAVQTNLALAYWGQGNEPAAHSTFIQAVDSCRASGDLFNEAACISCLVTMEYFHGDLNQAAALCREALADFDNQQELLGRRAPYTAEIGIRLASILIEQNRLEEAEKQLKENMELAKWTMAHNILIRGNLEYSRLEAARGNLDKALRHLAESEAISPEGSLLSGAQRAWLGLAFRDRNPELFQQALEWAHQQPLSEFGADSPQVTWTLSSTRAEIELTSPPSPSLIDWIERQKEAMHSRGLTHWEVRLLILEGLARQKQGDHQAALAAFRGALELAEPGDHVRVFVESGETVRGLLAEIATLAPASAAYVKKLLAAFPGASKRTIQSQAAGEGLVEALTRREIELLGLICQGLSNQEIAEKLFISLSTVKKHSYSIFQKLGVSNRTQAVLAAQKLSLV